MSRSLLAMMVLLTLVAGCSDPVNLTNYNKIKPGMTLKEVETLMGRPPKSYESVKTWFGRNGRRITVEVDDRNIVVNQSRDGF